MKRSVILKRLMVCACLLLACTNLCWAKKNYSTNKVEHRLTFGLGAGTAFPLNTQYGKSTVGPNNLIESSSLSFQRFTQSDPYYYEGSVVGEQTVFTPYRYATPIKTLIGGNALVDFGYEVRKKRFLFGFGVRFNYDRLCTGLDSMEIAFGRGFGRADNPTKYSYCFSEYTDKLTNLSIQVPIYFGMEAGNWTYWHVGAVAGYTLSAHHKATALMDTEFQLLRFIGTGAGTFINVPNYAAFPVDEYQYKAPVEMVNRFHITPMVEVGARFQVSERVQMRLGLYVGYSIQLAWDADKTKDVAIVDFHNGTVNDLYNNENVPARFANQYVRSLCCTGVLNKMETVEDQQAMKDIIRKGIVFNPILYSELQRKEFSNMVIGIKWTTVVRVGRTKLPCNCWSEFDIHPRQAKVKKQKNEKIFM